VAAPLRRYVIGTHAVEQMRRRRISHADVRSLLATPAQRFVQFSGREVFQAKVWHAGRVYHLRVIVDTWREPAEVLTAYRTSKVAKYWRTDEGSI
jgi:hypothetical protein